MDDSRKSRTPQVAVRACLECQKRKTKCTGGNESTSSCAYCLRSRKECIYEAPPSRTPLTRKNLDAAELRCRQLEALIMSMSPEIDIDTALSNLGKPLMSNPNSKPESRAASPTPADEYEWHESSLPSGPKPAKDANVIRDGMASLTTRTSGYLGTSSGSNLLQAISALLPRVDNDAQEPQNEVQSVSRATENILPDFASNEQFTTTIIVDRLIDAYFLFYNTSYPILHERTFRERYMNGGKAHKKSSWQLIFYMVLAIGHWVSGAEGDGDSPYYAAARSRFSVQMLESGTLGTVQAFLLMGNYLQKRDRPNTGYNLIGIAYRMALGLGLHREISSSVGGDTLARERRRQVFWTLFCFDSGFSITTGRPTTASDAFVDVQMPRNIDDSHCTLVSPVPNEVSYPTTYSAIIAQARLAVIANRIYTEFLSAKTSKIEVDHNTAGVMEKMLVEWQNTLPTYFRSQSIPHWFRGPRAVIFWKEQNLRIMLWRGSQRHHTTWDGKVEAGLKCQHAAIETINEISSFCREHFDALHLGLNWYATYFLLQAILVLDIHHLEKPVLARLADEDGNSGEMTWRAAIQQARECLELLGRMNKAANRCLGILDRIHDHFNANESNPPSVAAGSTFNPMTMPGEHSADGEIYQYQPEETTPDAATMYGGHWAMSADPSLHMFLDDTPMDDVFQGVEGFPSTLDQEYFDYITGSLYPV